MPWLAAMSLSGVGVAGNARVMVDRSMTCDRNRHIATGRSHGAELSERDRSA